jgi:hypothetical protein
MDDRAWADFYDQTTGTLDDAVLAAEFHRLWDRTTQTAPVEDAASEQVMVEAEASRRPL